MASTLVPTVFTILPKAESPVGLAQIVSAAPLEYCQHYDIYLVVGRVRVAKPIGQAIDLGRDVAELEVCNPCRTHERGWGYRARGEGDCRKSKSAGTGCIKSHDSRSLLGLRTRE